MSSPNDAMSVSDLKNYLLHENEKNVYILNVLTTQRATLDKILQSLDPNKNSENTNPTETIQPIISQNLHANIVNFWNKYESIYFLISFFIFKLLKDSNEISKIEKLKIASLKLISKSTIHGLPKIVDTDNNILRAMWVIFTAVAAVLCIFMFNSMENEYYKYEVITKTTTISESLALFPSIVMCKEEASTSIIDSVDSCWSKVSLR
jgi:hypothetical protein